jgi:hypothetical protein
VLYTLPLNWKEFWKWITDRKHYTNTF